MLVKPCRVCRATKGVGDEFAYLHDRQKHSNRCKSCDRDYARARFRNKPLVERRAESRRKRLASYGITQAQLDQKDCSTCEICAQALSFTGPRKFLPNVDHCHKTGAFRGILCVRCNTGLGSAGESVQTLRAMIDYLSKHGQN